MMHLISQDTYDKAINACDHNCENCRYVQLVYPNSFDDPYEVCPLLCEVAQRLVRRMSKEVDE